MPKLSKKALSLFIRTGCYRQFALYLYNDSERNKHEMATRQQSRFALAGAAQQGNSWQFQKTNELINFYGTTNVIHDIRPNRITFEDIDLATELPQVQPFQFIVEASFKADTAAFRQITGFTNLRDKYNDPLTVGEARPDLIQVLPALNDFASLDYTDDFLWEISATGKAIEIAKTDLRRRLRVIDIKLASEPGAHYYAEVIYYSLALAAWLHEHGLGDQFAVVTEAAVWPGSHEASKVAVQVADWKGSGYTPTLVDITHALEQDFEVAPFDVFAPRLVHIFSVDIPYVLGKSWDALTYHVSPTCKGCEFLGFPWQDKNGNPTHTDLHCLPTAEQTSHLSRVPGLTKSGAKYLRSVNVADTLSLGVTPVGSSIFDANQSLRAKRTTFPYRANELASVSSSVIPDSGGDALMPRWPDLHIYLFLDYDLSSAISVAFCIKAFWMEPFDDALTTRKTQLEHTANVTLDETFIVDIRSADRERTEFIRFLHTLKDILDAVETEDKSDLNTGRRTTQSTYQIYFWDVSQQKHLIRLVSRHLAHILNDSRIKNLAWLFPSPELLSHPEDAARNSPFTLVESVIINTIAAPIPFHYNLVELSQHYHRFGTYTLSFHPLYEEPFSDLMPAERINDLWGSPSGRGNKWWTTYGLIRETIGKKATALRNIVQRLEDDLRPVLSRQSAPTLQRPDRSGAKLSDTPYSQMLYEFTRLNAALERLDTEIIRSMPPHEREAKFKSARLTRRLSGTDEVTAQSRFIHLLGKQLPLDAVIYELNSASYNVNLKNGAINLYLSPENEPSFLDRKVLGITRGTPLEDIRHQKKSVAQIGLTEVSVIAIDRTNGLIALQPGFKNQVVALEMHSLVDLSTDVMLDHIATDYASKKVNLTLEAIGNPTVASVDIAAFNALGLVRNTPRRKKAPAPVTVAAEFLWEMARLANTTVNRNVNVIEQNLKNAGFNLNLSQWVAWHEALTKRVALIWGPPGTGKSQTLRAVIVAAVQDAMLQNRPLRLLITANTYTAIDNVLLEVDDDLSKFLPGTSINLVRVKSGLRADEDVTANHPNISDLVLDKRSPSPEINALLNNLNQQTGIVIVGTHPQQLHNLAQVGAEKIVIRNNPPKIDRTGPTDAQEREATIKPFFDLVLIDEASQLDVAMSTLVFSKIAPGGICVLAGDDLQIPPIHKADAPEGFETRLGSVYSFARDSHQIPSKSLSVNYRSNQAIVNLTKLAGYEPGLTSHSPDLQLNLITPLPATKPANWPSDLYWTEDWSVLANPELPVAAFTYEDDISSQINTFEADAVAAIICQYHSRLADSPKHENDVNGKLKPFSTTLYSADDFWRRGIGIVTPHRAQMSLIINRLQEIFPNDNPELIREAVDTVERFQGQQRDVIIASFGLGDPDLISGEEEFLFNRNRFNVLVSRARAKLIVLATQSVVNHLPSDGDVLEESRFMKRFFELFCTNRKPLTLGFINAGGPQIREGILRSH